MTKFASTNRAKYIAGAQLFWHTTAKPDLSNPENFHTMGYQDLERAINEFGEDRVVNVERLEYFYNYYHGPFKHRFLDKPGDLVNVFDEDGNIILTGFVIGVEWDDDLNLTYLIDTETDSVLSAYPDEMRKVK